jgi:hypothetical protein
MESPNDSFRVSLFDDLLHRVHTEWQWPIFLAYIPSWWKNQPKLVRVGGCTLTPFHSIFHHVQSCSVRSSWEGRSTLCISSLSLYVLCGLMFLLYWNANTVSLSFTCKISQSNIRKCARGNELFFFNYVAIVLLVYSREDVSLANSVLSTKSLVEASADTIGNAPVQTRNSNHFVKVLFFTEIWAYKDEKTRIMIITYCIIYTVK